MSVAERAELSDSSLADLYALAAERGIEGYRRLARNELIDHCRSEWHIRCTTSLHQSSTEKSP